MFRDAGSVVCEESPHWGFQRARRTLRHGIGDFNERDERFATELGISKSAVHASPRDWGSQRARRMLLRGLGGSTHRPAKRWPRLRGFSQVVPKRSPRFSPCGISRRSVRAALMRRGSSRPSVRRAPGDLRSRGEAFAAFRGATSVRRERFAAFGGLSRMPGEAFAARTPSPIPRPKSRRSWEPSAAQPHAEVRTGPRGPRSQRRVRLAYTLIKTDSHRSCGKSVGREEQPAFTPAIPAKETGISGTARSGLPRVPQPGVEYARPFQAERRPAAWRTAESTVIAM